MSQESIVIPAKAGIQFVYLTEFPLSREQQLFMHFS